MSAATSKIQTIFSEVLHKSESEILLDKTIFVDLGVESVEALELEFSLEETFDLKIGEKDLWKLPTYIASNNLISENRLNDDAKILVKQNYKSMTEEQIDALSSPTELHKYLTVGDVIIYIERFERDAA